VTRTALEPSYAHNPAVESEKPGYCVEVANQLLCCPIDQRTHGCHLGARLGFCKASGPVKVWTTLYSAREVAIVVGGSVVTVPRIVGETSKGVVLTWSAVA
jgi:hypothetical protein